MPLSDVRVVDFGQAIAGPICATYLSDLGAEVVKIEPPGGDVYRADRREKNGVPYNPPFEQYNRNKRSICIDLKSDEGYEAVRELIEAADVLVQNWPPGVAERLGVDYERCKAINEELIYVHVSGYGETGELAKQPAMDTIIQHASGLSSMLGYDDGKPPIRSQSSVADFYAGCHATISTLAALRERDNGGGGQKIDVSLLESLMHNMDGVFEYYHNEGEVPKRVGRSAFFNPDMLYGAARAKDDWVCVALLLYSDRMWKGFCELTDNEQFLEEPKYQTDDGRLADAAELTAIFEEWLAEIPAEEAIETLSAHGIPAGPHHTIDEAANMQHVADRELFREIDHPRLGPFTVTDTPLSLSETPTRDPVHAPGLGEHGEAILEEMGYDAEEIDELRSSGVLQ